MSNGITFTIRSISILFIIKCAKNFIILNKINIIKEGVIIFFEWLTNNGQNK